MHSQVMESLGGLKKHFVSSKDLAAIRNWFLEFYLHTKPYQEEAHINLNKTFYRFHFIVGTFERAMATFFVLAPSLISGSIWLLASYKARQKQRLGL